MNALTKKGPSTMTVGENRPSLVFTIFGSTGDLTYRKLIPALYHLEHRGLLATDFEIRCIGRKAYTQEAYWAILEPWLKKQSRFKLDDRLIESFKHRIRYIQLEFTLLDAYRHLTQYPQGQDNLYYFAVAPSFFEAIAQHLKASGYLDLGHHRVILEKPFGDSLAHASQVHDALTSIFGEEQLYHIDHYLGKEMIQNILALRFTNRLFEGVWNASHIESIQITAAETVGVETRGSYYEQAGALKDMIQNHLIQILSYVLMEEPQSLMSQDLSSQQLKVFKALSLDRLLVGQYGASENHLAYREEALVNPLSTVETYAAVRGHLTSGPLQNVPLFLRTGKSLNHRATYIKVIFKPSQSKLYASDLKEVLTIKVQPDEGVSFQFNAKKPGTLNTITSVQMDFCQSCILENRINTPEAYERLLDDAFHQDNSLFTPWNLVERGWQFGKRLEQLRQQQNLPLVFYPAGSSGPKESDDWIAEEGFVWLDENEYSFS